MTKQLKYSIIISFAAIAIFITVQELFITDNALIIVDMSKPRDLSSQILIVRISGFILLFALLISSILSGYSLAKVKNITTYIVLGLQIVGTVFTAIVLYIALTSPFL